MGLGALILRKYSLCYYLLQAVEIKPEFHLQETLIHVCVCVCMCACVCACMHVHMFIHSCVEAKEDLEHLHVPSPSIPLSHSSP